MIFTGIFFLSIILPTSLFALPGIDIEAAVGGWKQSPTGDLSYVSGGEIGIDDTLDFENDLKYDDQTSVTGRFILELPVVPNIYLMAAPAEFDGDGIKDMEFSFGDNDFHADVPFYSKVTLNQYDIGLYYGIPLLQTATLNKLNIDLGVNARILDIKGELKQDESNLSESESATLLVPMLFLAAQFRPIERFAVEAEGRGISIGGNTVLSVIARLKVKIVGPAFAAAGYRYDSIDIDEDDVKLDTSIGGPFFEAGVQF
ncbi:MAG: TIGR04219 family outer membrane beta-barrel protein [Deltaproteobacteria bacterium]|nr:TIGR04219 family outer membrane beta-barrel protein [Deltaproteobacteria bacterium]MBW2218576.1 TIGR04219 family outer membrane beta-barrel protein [Deltaproteobacteria bacterium]